MNTMNSVTAAIRERRSVRKFTAGKVKPELLDELLQAALFAPSTKGKQERHFIAVTGEAEINKLHELAKKVTLSTEIEGEKRYVYMFEKPNFHISYHAPLLIITAAETGHGKNPEADCAVAIENMLLAAHSLGLGGVWINQLNPICDNPIIRGYLNAVNVPQSYKIYGSAAFGYPAEGVVLKALPRKDNIISYIGE